MKLTREDLISRSEVMEQTIFEQLTPGIGLVTVSVRFTYSKLINTPNGYQPLFKVYTHIAGTPYEKEYTEEWKVVEAINEAVERISELSSRFRIVQTA